MCCGITKYVGEKAVRKMKIGKAIRISELLVETVQRNGTVIYIHNTRRGIQVDTDDETDCMNA